MSPPQSDADRRKQAVAFEAGREQLRSGQSIGVGSGSTAKFLVDYIAGEVRNGRLTDVRFVPTSFQVCFFLHFFSLFRTLMCITDAALAFKRGPAGDKSRRAAASRRLH